MRISVDLPWASAEAHQSVNQTVVAFGAALAKACAEQPAFELITHLDFGLSIMHPLIQSLRKVTVSHQRSTGTFFASAPLEYLSWVGDDWGARVGAIESALVAATAKIHKTRITQSERAAVFQLLAETRSCVSGQPPPKLEQLAPVHLLYVPGGANPSISFVQPPKALMDGATMVTLRPIEIEAFLQEYPVAAEPKPPSFKLYRRAGGQLEYREAWATDDGRVVEHWGACGRRGETLGHAAPSAAVQRKVLSRLKSHASSAGFRSIPRSRHLGLLVSRKIDGFGSTADLDERHALEDYLNELTGWLGLGHCDGGSIGSSSMEAFCWVVDLDIAIEAIGREIHDSPFSAFLVSAA